MASGSNGGTAESGSAEIRTFLIADVRGYTLFTQERGDEAAGRLAKRFADVARQGIEARGGTLLELRGDEALAVFGSSRQAIRTAVELQQRFADETVADPDLPLRVGIGIDAGEAVPIEGGYRGRALNLAARLCGQAVAGQILASREAVHLAGAVEGIRAIDRGPLHLKGISDPVAVMRIVPVGPDPADVLKRYAPSTPKLRRARRSLLVVGAAAIAAVVLVVSLPAIMSNPAAIAVSPGTVLFDLDDATQVRSIPTSRLAVTGYPRFVDGKFWLNNFTPSSYVQIDPESGRIEREISAPSPDSDVRDEPHSESPYAVDGNTLWAAVGDDVVKMDIERGREIDRFHLDELLGGEGVAEGVAVGAGSLWVSRASGIGQVARLDPDNGRVEQRWDDMWPNANLVFADGSLWVADDGGIVRIDAETNRISKADLFDNFRVAAGGGFGWTTNEDKGVVYKVGPSGDIVAQYQTGLGAGHMAYLDGTLWVANHDIGTITGIDAITGKMETLTFEHPVTTLAAGAGRLLIGVEEGRSVEDSIDSLQGDVAKLIAYKSQIGAADTALDAGPAAFQIAYATCARLLNYPDEPAPGGWELRPEVAASMPEVSEDGRTYTFRIRPGFAFSPPENELVTAATFKYSIERALSPRLTDEAQGWLYIDDIEGERAFRSGGADHISGIRAEDDETLSITLVRPSEDFLHRLALPFFCPVPLDTPIVPGGSARGGTGVAGGYHVPSAGPYYIYDRNNEEYVILKRNPNYAGPRPQALDAIVLREGIDAGLAVERIEQGGWDGITALFDPLLDPGGPIDQRWGRGSGATEADPSYLPAPRPHTGYLVLNAGRGIFADRDVRRAAALALDRSSLAAVWAQTPTDAFLPPSMPGSDDPSVAEPDLGEARRLMRGKTGSAVMPVFDGCDPCLVEAEVVRDDLARIGIDLRIRVISNFDVVFEPGARFDVLDWGTEFPYPDPVSFLEQMLLRDVPAGWLPTGIRERIERVNHLSGQARLEAAIRLADRLATEDVPVVVVGTAEGGTVIGPRLGCRVFPPFGFGVDLAALCLVDGS
jgi:ABC-type transport system substrate-binding protein/class 3 adenylate cyclase